MTSPCFVMPVWKHGWQVQNAIRSIQEHEPNAEFIFINNGADADVKSVIGSVGPAEIITNEQNMLVNYAWNQGLSRAIERREDLVILVNSDILLHSSIKIIYQLLRDGIRGTYVPWPGGKDGHVRLGDGEHLPGFFMGFPGGILPLVLPIPTALRLWFGDNYLEARLRKLGFPVYGVDIWVEHVHGGSQNVNVLPGLDEIIEHDKLAWEEISRQYGIVGRP